MHILMSSLHPVGGIRTFFRYIYGHPVFSGNVFTLVAPDNGLSEYISEFLPDKRISVIPAETNKLLFLRQLRSIAQKEPFDLIHSHGFSAGMLSELSRTGLVLPHLMTGHDVFMPVQFSGFSGRLRHWFMARLFRRMTGIHTISEDARRNLIAFFPSVSTARVHCILNGVDTHYFRDSVPKALKEKIGLTDEVPLIGFFGRFMSLKGFRLLVDAMERIVNDRLLGTVPHVATFGWNGFIREDYIYLREKGLGDYFHQFEQTREIGGMLKAVDLVAIPSLSETCPLLAMEALAAGVPIVGSDCIGLREVLAGSPARPFRSGDATSLMEAIVTEIKQIVERKRTFMDYQSQAVERFAIDNSACALAALYAELSKSGNI